MREPQNLLFNLQILVCYDLLQVDSKQERGDA